MISFVVEGKAEPKPRPRFNSHTGRAYEDKTSKAYAYRTLVALRAKSAMVGREPLTKPMIVMIDCRTEPPARWAKYKREAAIRNGWDISDRGDADNIAKNIMDACNGIVWQDDCQVVGLIVTRRYAEESETIVEIIEPDNNRSPIWAVSSIRRNLHNLSYEDTKLMEDMKHGV